ncbi:MAG: ribonuclease P protein component [Solirubrobacterales bacterium]
MARGEAGARRRRRLSRSGDFDRVYREGDSHANRYLVLYAFPRESGEEDGPRLGVSVGRKVGSAVERNRVKRVLRESFWGLAESVPAGSDFVLVARPEISALLERDGSPGVAEAVAEAADALGRGRST